MLCTNDSRALIVPDQRPVDYRPSVLSIEETGRCHAICKSPDGERCSMPTSLTWPYCRLHLQMHCGLDVQPSQYVSKKTGDGVGLGLFATRRFERGDFVSLYSGDVLRWDSIDRRYPEKNADCKYLFHFNDRWCIDARSTQCHVARYINDFRNTRPAASENCLFENISVTIANSTRGCSVSRFATQHKMIIVRATRTVEAGEEFFCNYGDDYTFPGEKCRVTCPSQSLDATSSETYVDHDEERESIDCEEEDDPDYDESEHNDEETEGTEEEDNEVDLEQDNEADPSNEDDFEEIDDEIEEEKEEEQSDPSSGDRTFDDPMDIDYVPSSEGSASELSFSSEHQAEDEEECE